MNQNSLVCSNCRTPNPPTNLYCQSCGRPLLPASAAPAPSAPQPSDATMPIPPSSASQPQPHQPQTVYTPPAYTPPSPPPQAPGYPPAGAGQPPVYPQGAYPPPQPPPGYPQGQAPQGYGQPQPGYYPPQPMRPAPAPVMPTLENQGVRVDGWSDLVPGEGEKAAAVEQGFVEEINQKAFPFAKLSKADFYAGPTRRSFQLFGSTQGSIAVSIASVGKDLSVSWDLFVKQKPNIRMLAILAGAVVLLSLFSAIENRTYNFGAFLLGLFFGVFNQVLLVLAGGLIAGKVMKGDFFAFFLEKPDLLAQQDLAAMALAVHQALRKALEDNGVDVSTLRSKNIFKGGDNHRKI